MPTSAGLDHRVLVRQGHSWGLANVSRAPDAPSTWLIEAAVAPAGDEGRRLLQVCLLQQGCWSVEELM